MRKNLVTRAAQKLMNSMNGSHCGHREAGTLDRCIAGSAEQHFLQDVIRILQTGTPIAELQTRELTIVLSI